MKLVPFLGITIVGGPLLVAGGSMAAAWVAARRSLHTTAPRLLCLGYAPRHHVGLLNPETGLVYRPIWDDVIQPWEFWQPLYVRVYNSLVREAAQSGVLDVSSLRKRVRTRSMMEQRFRSETSYEAIAGMPQMFSSSSGVGVAARDQAGGTRLQLLDAAGAPIKEVGWYRGSVRFIMDEMDGVLLVWDQGLDSYEVWELESGLVLQRLDPE